MSPPLAVVLPRQPGTKESRYAHLLSGQIDAAADVPRIAATVVDSDVHRVERLEEQVASLREEVRQLKEMFEGFASSSSKPPIVGAVGSFEVCTGHVSPHGGSSFTSTHRMTNGRMVSTIAEQPFAVDKPILYVVYPRKLLEKSWPPITTFQRMAKMPIRVSQPATMYIRLRIASVSRATCVTASIRDRRERAQQDLDHDLRTVQLGVDHEIQAAERLVGFVDAVDQVQHFQGEIDEERVEQILRHGVQAAHVTGSSRART